MTPPGRASSRRSGKGRGPRATRDSLLELLRNGVAHLPAVAAVAARHLGRDPWKATSVGLRAAPGPLRRAARRDLVRRRLPLLAVVADAADGRSVDAVAALESLVATGDVGKLRAGASVAAVLGRPDLSAALLHRLPERDPARLRLQALSAWVDGSLHEAVGLARSARAAGDRQARSLTNDFEGELALLEATAVRAMPARPGPPSRPPRGAGSAAPSVLHVVTNALPEVQAGYTIRTQGIARAQRDHGIDAQVVTRLGFPIDSGRLAPKAHFEHDGVPTHRLLPWRGVPVRADARQATGVDHLVRLAQDLRVDLLHAHSRHDNGQVALLAGAELGLPVVYEARGFLEETWRSRGGAADTDFYRLSRQAETACMQAADAVVTVSEPMRADIVARGVDPAKVVVVGNAVGGAYLEEPPDAGSLRRELGIAPDAVTVGLVSTLNDYEGVEILLEAAARIPDDRLVVLVVGDGPARGGLEDLARRRLPGGRAIFTGRVPHAAARTHHAAIDVFCVPRRRTAVTTLVPPLKPVEAMATGRPVIVSDLPPLVELAGADQLLEPGEEAPGIGPRGLVAAADDPASWEGALSTLLYDPALRADMGLAARRWVIEHRTWDAAARTYGDLYARVLNVAQSDPREDEGVVRAS